MSGKIKKIKTTLQEEIEILFHILKISNKNDKRKVFVILEKANRYLHECETHKEKMYYFREIENWLTGINNFPYIKKHKEALR